jgi:ribosomal-protein-alanine N-acetyltransferase
MRFPLVGERVELRPFRLGDAGAAHRIYGDPEVMRHVGHGPAESPAVSEAMLREYIATQERVGYGFWAVIDRASGALAGDAGLYPGRGAEVELGFTLGREWWGRGLATEAGGLCVAAAFGELGLRELTALVEPANHASLNVLGKLGHRPAGERAAFGRPHLLYRLERPPGAAGRPA